MDPSPSTVTSLLAAWSQGDRGSMDQLFTLLYRELRQIAGNALNSRQRAVPLQPTELLNEAYLRLSAAAGLRVEDRAHFLALACRAMRMVLVDSARAANRDKRGGGAPIVTLGAASAVAVTHSSATLLDLDTALNKLFALDPGPARMVELHYFAGLSYAEIASEVDLSEATVHRHLRLAKAWLARELAQTAVPLSS
ncbi:MAG: ECF-type sigma factor [Acidobacteria bacterium]|nr:ECF-type sigma factor [Acidobacteriota bacterium]